MISLTQVSTFNALQCVLHLLSRLRHIYDSSAPANFKFHWTTPAPAELSMPGPGPAIILSPVDHWCCDDPDIINIGDFRKFHTFDKKTAKSVKGYLCFLSKKFDPLKFFCPVHHSSPVK